jgi:polyisoprenoid-binding protein YceI
MGHKIISIFLLSICISAEAQQYLSNDGLITFFSQAPLENISAKNNKVSAAYDLQTNEIVFQLQIQDFVFPNALMQEHFNENYLESDLFPHSTFVGEVMQNKNGKATVVGDLTIHGETNEMKVEGLLRKERNQVTIFAEFEVKLEDYNIKIPRIVMYKIAEEIEIKVNIELKEVK